MGAGPSQRTPVSPDQRIENFTRQFLLRWGVLLRDLLARETVAPPWRDLLPVLRRMEARGEIRGGRFISGFTGEQFARPEALDMLRALRREEAPTPAVPIANADPLNLTGIIMPGPRVSRLAVAAGYPTIWKHPGDVEPESMRQPT